MCTLFLAIEQHQEYPIILIENRDEFIARKSLSAHWWPKTEIFAGKDLEKGGTWMGVHRAGDFAVVTNYRDLSMPLIGEKSRGELIPYILSEVKSKQSAEDYLNNISEITAPFNLIFSIAHEVFYFSSVTKILTPLLKGIYGLSNAFLDTPWWKVTQGKNVFRQIIEEKEIDREKLFELMKNTKQAPDEQLPKTGLPIEREKLVSALFIQSEDYGTICTTFYALNKKGKYLFEERRVDGKITEL